MIDVLQAIKKKHLSSGGHCGVFLTDFEGDFKEIKKKVNELFKLGKITIHDGIHGKLIKYKDENN